MRLAVKLGQPLSLRFFPRPDPARGCEKHWLARTAGHYYTSDTCRLVCTDEDYPGNVANGEGWGDTPELAIEDLLRSMLERRKSTRDASEEHARTVDAEIETLLALKGAP